jgi:hypothetical protein
MVLPLCRCSFAVRRGARTGSLALLGARQCLSKNFTQSSLVHASKRETLLGAWDKCMVFN